MILNGLCVKNQTKKIYLITGAAGFIGSLLCLKLTNNNQEYLIIFGKGSGTIKVNFFLYNLSFFKISFS